MADNMLLQKFEELSVRLSAVEEQNNQLRKENALLKEREQQLQQENRLLRQKLDYYIRHYFGGRRNEGLDRKQMELLLQGLPAVIELPAAARPEPAPRRSSDSASHSVRRVLADEKLETRETVIEPEEVKAQPEGWRKISEERTTLLDWEPGKFFKQVIIRPRYVKAEQFALAPLPPQPVEQGMAGAGLLAEVIVKKYEHHQPLYRLEKIFKQQHRIELSRKTMGSWIESVIDLLKPIYQAIREELQKSNYLQADETPIRCLDPDIKGKSVLGYLWTYGRPRGDVLFEWRMSRSREGPEEFLKEFRGSLQTDAYAVYESLAKARQPDLRLIGCWAHARRGFKEALPENKIAAWFIKQIGFMYAVEAKLRAQRAGPKLRLAVRAWQTTPVLTRLRKAMEIVRRRTLPQGALGKAIDYVLSRWETFTRFAQDGKLEIDNNLIENAIRPTALGKKNWLFIGHPGAGERSAVIYTLLGGCRRHGINPFDYFKDILTRLPAAKITQIEEFTPGAWAKARRNEIAKAA